MNRRKFLKYLGIGAATPTILGKLVAEKPRYLIYTSTGPPPREIYFSKIDKDPFRALQPEINQLYWDSKK